MTELETKPRLKDVVRELKQIEVQKKALWQTCALVSSNPLLTTSGALREIVRLGRQEAELFKWRKGE